MIFLVFTIAWFVFIALMTSAVVAALWRFSCDEQRFNDVQDEIERRLAEEREKQCSLH